MEKKFGIFSFILFIAVVTQAQPIADQKTVEAALLDIEERYQVRFSYSKDIVPHDDMVVLGYRRKSLTEVLEDLGSQTGIVYKLRGTRVVLNYDASLINPHATTVAHSQVSADIANELVDGPSSGAENGEILLSEDLPVPEPRDQTTMIAINEREQKRELSHERIYEAKGLQIVSEQEIQWAQVSFLPTEPIVGRKSTKINHFSLNVLAGYNGGLEGIEVGAFANGIKKDVKGMQVAGVVNYVGGNVEGGQVAGFGNFNKGIVHGIQVGGLANINEQTDGVQFAGGFNLNRRVSRGYQVAGFFNASRNISGGQLAGFLNVSLGNTYFQTAGFCNVAENIDVQVSGIVNVAKNVRHFQIGLINVADTVGDFSFGLLNLIKRGYNKVEFSIGDALYGNVAIKLGTRKFYNIFQVGTNFKRNILANGYTWGYGYGFGFFKKMAKDFKINPELLVSNVQERRIIKPELNLLSQVKMLFHFTEGRRIEVFGGPTLNLMISKLNVQDGQVSGTQIAPYTLYEQTYFGGINPINTKFWIGFNAGVRI